MDRSGWDRREVAISAAIVCAAAAWQTMILVSWRQTAPDYPALRVVGSAVTGILFVLCGLIARRRTPYPRMGWVLVAAGACWMAEDFAVVETTFGNDAAQLTGATSAFGFAFAAFAFPTGRLRTNVERGLIGALAVYSFGLSPISGVLNTCEPCGANFTGVALSKSTDDFLSSVLNVYGLVVLCVAAVVFAHRWGTATRPERRMVAPLMAASLVIALVNVPKVIDPDSNLMGNFLPLSFALAPLALLTGLARVRLVRIGITSIVQQLDSAASLPQLRGALRSALGDKNVAIRTWEAWSGAWLDEEGEPVSGPESPPGVQATAIDARDGRPLGVLHHDPALAHDPDLLQGVVGAIRLALENAALHSEVSAQLARAADAAHGERRRVARDLHDGAQQRLLTLMFDVAALDNSLGPTASPEVRHRLSVILDGARGALADLRRLVQGTVPPMLSDEGLGTAIREIALGVPVQVVVDDKLTARLPPEIESAAFLMVAESLANITKHAQARGARVLLERRGDELHIAVSDDGCGGADPSGGTGIRGLQERAEAYGGHVTISSPAGRGTTVGIRLPTQVRPALRVVG